MDWWQSHLGMDVQFKWCPKKKMSQKKEYESFYNQIKINHVT